MWAPERSFDETLASWQQLSPQQSFLGAWNNRGRWKRLPPVGEEDEGLQPVKQSRRIKVSPEVARSQPAREVHQRASKEEIFLKRKIELWKRWGVDPDRIRIGKPQRHPISQFDADFKFVEAETWVPRAELIKLIDKENPWFDPLYKVPWDGNSAFWIWQHTKEIRTIYANRIPWGYDIYNPRHQIWATALYLKDMKWKRNYPWDVAMALYHVWTWIFRVPLSTIQHYMSLNGRVRNIIPPDKRASATWLDYFSAALALYGNRRFEDAKQVAMKYFWWNNVW
jgi:hypothetical protein